MRGEAMHGVTFDYADCRVLVTGGTSGIGLAIATAYADAGAHVTVTGRRAAAGDYEVDLARFDYRELALADPNQIESVAASLDTLDVLINNAGGTHPGGQDENQPDGFEASLAMNLSSHYRMAVCCKEKLAASELEGGASIIHIASMSSYFGVAFVPGYGAAKAAIVQTTKYLGAHWYSDGIRANAVAAGLIETSLTAPMKSIETLTKPHMDRTPMGRWGTSEDIAPAVLFLTSPQASFITGQTLAVDGGYTIA
jgi:NAD(P)-dependent dehydrogenase (short-subunit alcohol dehydrogenase family)